MKKRKKNRSAQSNIIATVLIILLVLAAIIIVWTVVKNLIDKSTSQASILPFIIKLEAPSLPYLADGCVYVNVKRKPGKGELEKIKFIFKTDTGEEEYYIEDEKSELPKELETKKFEFCLDDISDINISDIVKISFVPIFKNNVYGEVNEADIGQGAGDPCEGVVCDDSNECTYGVCVSGLGCQYANNDSGDSCSLGVCDGLGSCVECNVDGDCSFFPPEICESNFCISFSPTIVIPTMETDPVQQSGDKADDPAIWVHPTNPELSVIIGTNKDDTNGGLLVYDLDGNEIASVLGVEANNVDVRYNFTFDGRLIDIVVTDNRDDDTLVVYEINPTTRRLTRIDNGGIPSSLVKPYGLCLYHNKSSNKHYVFVNDGNAPYTVRQFELFDDGDYVNGNLVRSIFNIDSKPEGMVADDELGDLYVGEEDVAIWKYGAEPGDGQNKVEVDNTGVGGNITAEIEGLTIYYTSDGNGYLIASAQGDHHYSVYDRVSNNFIMEFNISKNDELNIDGTSGTDGIDVISTFLGDDFPYGMFVSQDNTNSNPDENQNFKVVPWEKIANSIFPRLTIDIGWDVRL